MEIKNNILVERKESIIFQLNRNQNVGNGWIGGNAPAYFDEKSELLSAIESEYHFYLCFVSPLDKNNMISIFIPKEYENRVSKNIYPNCSLYVFEHPVSKESIDSTYTKFGMVKHYISEGILVSDEQAFDTPFFIKFGGNPFLIQEEYYYTELEKDKYSFLCQIDEDGYPDGLFDSRTSLPFGFGAVYLYAIVTEDSIKNPIVGYWQYS
ncbi:hypothetical protein ABE61_21120 [Lysinibacillus sphaericus]|uniref:hypothetical protein n=1 Tax=Lysinibacillus sphaericus TaxID=1421 RepID=UPI0019D50904|nr:hypothetical protein [Lysinibacillus sphaericus]MBG9456446.1 hypothetical protein [Lysinibacillus sphaericus]MBG9476520.1 hypothetical protein [Lysinibacillus sphaericus]MBG9594616.1 hypothetical protein [Lysinibacillus sphaericus]